MTTPPDVVLAVDVGGTTIKGELVDRAGGVLARVRRTTPRGTDARTAIAEVGDELLASVDDRVATSVVGAGVVVPGLVDAASGIATYSANIGWRDLDLVAPLSAHWGLPVRLGHDVAAAGVAESRLGAGRDDTHLAYVVIGTGIAAAVISDGRLLTGPHGELTELGHLRVRPGPRCGCGANGCLEAVASAAAIARNYMSRTGHDLPGSREVVDRLGTDAVADAVWSDAIDALADGIEALCLLLAPSLVVIGGGLSGAGDQMLKPLRAALESRIHVVDLPRLEVAALGDRGGVAGAALLAFDGWA